MPSSIGEGPPPVATPPPDPEPAPDPPPPVPAPGTERHSPDVHFAVKSQVFLHDPVRLGGVPVPRTALHAIFDPPRTKRTPSEETEPFASEPSSQDPETLHPVCVNVQL